MDSIHPLQRKAPSTNVGDEDSNMSDVLLLELLAQSHSTFYKDEGGRQSHMQVDLQIRPRQAVFPLKWKVGHIPLITSLLYENGYRVDNQDILVIVPSSTQLPETDENGRASIGFRIEEVSKNHQSLKFMLRISADTQHLGDFPDVIPVETAPILVLSKRTDRKRSAGDSDSPWRSFHEPEAFQRFQNTLLHKNVNDYGEDFTQKRCYSLQRSPLPDFVKETKYPSEDGMASPYGKKYHRSELGKLGEEAVAMLAEAEWHLIGQSVNARTGKIDPEQPILQCFICNTIAVGGFCTHSETCRLRNLLDKCNNLLGKTENSRVLNQSTNYQPDYVDQQLDLKRLDHDKSNWFTEKQDK